MRSFFLFNFFQDDSPDPHTMLVDCSRERPNQHLEMRFLSPTLYGGPGNHRKSHLIAKNKLTSLKKRGRKDIFLPRFLPRFFRASFRFNDTRSRNMAHVSLYQFPLGDRAIILLCFLLRVIVLHYFHTKKGSRPFVAQCRRRQFILMYDLYVIVLFSYLEYTATTVGCEKAPFWMIFSTTILDDFFNDQIHLDRLLNYSVFIKHIGQLQHSSSCAAAAAQCKCTVHVP